MDKHYASKLRSLSVTRKYIFHKVDYYSELIEFTKEEVEKEVLRRLNSEEIDLELYANFLKDMNSNFYIEKQEKIYWVSK